MTDQERAAIKRATVLAHRKVEQLDDATLADLEEIYRRAAAEIATAVRARAGEGETVSLYQLQDLLGQVEGRLRALSAARNDLLDGVLSTAARYGVEPYVSGGAFGGAAAMQVSDEAVRFVRQFVADDGLRLSDRIWRIDRGARDAVVNAIESAVIQGHGAAQAAREFLSRGRPVPNDIDDQRQAANAGKLARRATDQLMTGEGNAMDNAMRLFRTELNRAHGEAYMMGGEDHPDFGGWRFLLSPEHPEPDICDLLSVQNLHGLGDGVYPSREKCPWPAHPNTLSFIEIVFADEITEADRKGKETPVAALGRLSVGQRKGALGVNKAKIYDQGRLTQGMIRAPWRSVRKRVGIAPPPAVVRKPAGVAKRGPLGLDDVLELGAAKADSLIAAAARSGRAAEMLPETIFNDLNQVRRTGTEAVVRNGGKGAEMVRAASRLFPDEWTKLADNFGPLYAKASQSRGWQLTLPEAAAGRRFRYKGFQFVAEGNDGMIVAGSFKTALHEYTHRLQHALPGLDDLFQELHGRRTAGDPLRRLRDLLPGHGYASNEVTREDHYLNPYQGRIYSVGNQYLGRHGAMEVMTMAFETVFGGRPELLERMLEADREMFNLVIGALYHYVP